MAGVETSADPVCIELEKILSSPGFAHNKRLSGFLEYVVRCYLEGNGDQVKEVVIGTEVFGRKPNYDPRQDSVVRTEAARLRARLAEYYAAEGAADPVVIEIPKGRYAPVVRFAGTPAPTTGLRRRWAPAMVSAVLLFAAMGYWLVRQPRGGGGPPETLSIAVLPFVNLSPDPENEYFSDGLTEELIDGLAKVKGLRVPARSSSFAFKGKHQDIREIGSKLRVQMVLEGSVRKEGERIRVTAQLNKVADGYHVWSQTYDRDMNSVLGIQNEIARAIVTTLEIKLADNEGTGRPAANPEAHRLYLKARYFQNQGGTSPESQRKAIAYFEQAIDKDPNHALAFAGLAHSWLNIFVHDPARPPDALPTAETAARKALALDETASEAHASLANVLTKKWDWQGAEQEFQRAIELNPNNGRARLSYAVSCLAVTDRLDQALLEAKRAQDLDLVSPEVPGQLGMLLYYARQYDQAIEMSRKAIEMHAGGIGAWNAIGLSYVQKGMLAEATAAFEKAGSFGRRSHKSASLVGLYVRLGRRAEAEELVEKWKARPREDFGHAESMAIACAGIGDKDEAFRWLEIAYQTRWRGLPGIKIDSDYDSLRSDPRFDALLKKMGLQQRR
jgi:serine/threonine-protein kinase